MCFLQGKTCNILISNVGPDAILEAVLLHPFRFFFVSNFVYVMKLVLEENEWKKCGFRLLVT